MTPIQVIVWTCVFVFVITAILTVLDLSGLHRFRNESQRKALFTALILSVITTGALTFNKAIDLDLENLDVGEDIEISEDERTEVSTAKKDGELLVALLNKWDWQLSYADAPEGIRKDNRTVKYSASFYPETNSLRIIRNTKIIFGSDSEKVDTIEDIFRVDLDNLEIMTTFYRDTPRENFRLLYLAFGCKNGGKCVRQSNKGWTKIYKSREKRYDNQISSRYLLIETAYKNYELSKPQLDGFSSPYLGINDFARIYGPWIQ